MSKTELEINVENTAVQFTAYSVHIYVLSYEVVYLLVTTQHCTEQYSAVRRQGLEAVQCTVQAL